MSFLLASIVEGHGEAQAFPALLRRILPLIYPDMAFNIRTPQRTKRDRFIHREEERGKQVELARRACAANAEGGRILVLLDADDDCPVTLASSLANQCQHRVGPEVPISVIIANREYEAWFLASTISLAGIRGFDSSRIQLPADPDRPRNAKELIRQATGGVYAPVKDQAALSANVDPESAARNSRSFRKLMHELRKLKMES